jgi:hypothetical protein
VWTVPIKVFSFFLSLSRSVSLSHCFVHVRARALSQAHTTALERVEQQSNLAKQKAEDATNQAQEGLREAKTSKLLAQVPPYPFRVRVQAVV